MLPNKQMTTFHGSINIVWKNILERLYYHNFMILLNYSLKLAELTQKNHKSSSKSSNRFKYNRMIRQPGIVSKI